MLFVSDFFISWENVFRKMLGIFLIFGIASWLSVDHQVILETCFHFAAIIHLIHQLSIIRFSEDPPASKPAWPIYNVLPTEYDPISSDLFLFLCI